jgi:hypothetical protein
MDVSMEHEDDRARVGGELVAQRPGAPAVTGEFEQRRR